MNKILVALDGSDPSQHALRMGADIAARYGARLIALYVIPPAVFPPDAYPIGVQDIEAAHATWAEKMLRDVVVRLEEPGVAVDRRILAGAPADEIARVAREEGVDLVVVGSRGRSAAARVLLGSVSDRLVHICERPVLVVR